MMNTAAVLITIVLFVFSRVADAAQYPLTREVEIITKPAGAKICQKRSGAYRCFAVSPAKVPVVFRSENSSARFVLQRNGYKPINVILRPIDTKKDVRLAKRNIFQPPNRQKNEHLRTLQKRVNSLLDGVLLGSRSSFAAYALDIIGKISIERIKGRTYLKVSVLLDDSFRRGELRSLKRFRNPAERNMRLIDAVLRKDVGSFLTEIKRALIPARGIDAIALSANYSNKKLVAADDQRLYTQVYRSQIGDWIYTTYEKRRTGYLDVKAQWGIYTVLFITPMSAIPEHSGGRTQYEAIISGSAIYLNDNRKGKFIQFR